MMVLGSYKDMMIISYSKDMIISYNKDMMIISSKKDHRDNILELIISQRKQ